MTRPCLRPILLAMDWVPVVTLTAVFAGLTVALIRTVNTGRRRWMVALIHLTVVVLALRWAAPGP